MSNGSIRAWKAFRVDRQGRLRFLFRAHAGTSVVPRGTWVEAKARWVHEANSRRYRAGFHCFRDWQAVLAFQKLTKGKYVIREVLAADLRRKPQTRAGSWLARRLFVPKEEGHDDS